MKSNKEPRKLRIFNITTELGKLLHDVSNRSPRSHAQVCVPILVLIFEFLVNQIAKRASNKDAFRSSCSGVFEYGIKPFFFDKVSEFYNNYNFETKKMKKQGGKL